MITNGWNSSPSGFSGSGSGHDLGAERPEVADIDQDLNPHRGEEQRGPGNTQPRCFRRRGVLLFGDETDDELADLWSAVDGFESMVEARGGDTMTNAPDSAEPDNPAVRAAGAAGPRVRRRLYPENPDSRRPT